MLLYISIAFNVVFLVLLGAGLFFLHRAGQQINSYEQFYEQTLTELEKHLTYIQGLMKSSVILSDDDDVKKVFKSIKSYYQLMLGYVNAGDGTPAAKEKELLR